MNINILFLSILLAICLSQSVECRQRGKSTGNRTEKLFSLFQIVKFENEICGSTGGINGTCFTALECEQKGGANSGSCAEGFGICCTFSLSCGESSSQNNTHLIQTAAVTSGMCQYKICKLDADICRIRLDFNTFNIAGPTSGNTVDVGFAKGSAAAVGNCATDSFSVTAPGSAGSPLICGINTGQHMIVDASDLCHLATFSIGMGAMNRQWDIRVSQFTCDARSLAGPNGCLQYFTGMAGTISSYNFPTNTPILATTTHLSNQNYRICIRQEMGRCSICYTPSVQPAIQNAINQASFGLSVSGLAAMATAQTGTMCAQDFLIIPRALDLIMGNVLANIVVSANSKICGRAFASISGRISAFVQTNSVSVCSQTVPFTIDVFTDLGEISNAIDGGTSVMNEANTAPGGIVGFSLDYTQGACT